MAVKLYRIDKTPTLVTLKRYCHLTGDTDKAVYQRISAGKWLLGIQYVKCEGRIWVKFKEAQKWVLKQNRATMLALKASK